MSGPRGSAQLASHRSGALALAAGVALGVALYRLAPLPADDPLRGTLASMPAVIAALAWIGRWSRAAGARRLPPRLLQGQLLAAALLALAIPGRLALGLDHSALVVMVLLAALLASHVAARLLALRPLLGRDLRRQRRPSWVFLWLPLAAYLALIPWSAGQRAPDGDEPWYLLVTHSLVHDFDADLTNNYAAQDWRAFIDRPLTPQQGDPHGRHGELYSRHNMLLPLALAPAYALAGKLGALATMALLTALLAWTTLLLGRHYFPRRPGEVLAAYGLVAFTPPLLLYSYQVWVEVPAALLSMLALDRILRLRNSRAGTPAGTVANTTASTVASTIDWRRWRPWLVIGLCLLLLPLVKLRFVLLAATLLFLAWWHSGRALKPALVTGSGLAVLGAGILLFNQAIYGNPLKIHTWDEVLLHERAGGDFLEGVPGLFFDSAFGLFAAAPLWLLLLPAALLLLTKRSRTGGAAGHPAADTGRGMRRLWFDLIAFASLYFLVVAPRAEWYGGWSPPFRYALVLLPLFGLALVPLLAARRRPSARALMAGLAAATLALALLWIAVPGWTYNFADGRTYLLDHLSGRLKLDVARLFPSSVRPRLATWLWPPACLLAVTALWWLPRRRRGGQERDGQRSDWQKRGRLLPWLATSPALGMAALLAAAAAVPPLARALPTRVVELEDPQVVHSGGHAHPDRWTNLRTAFRGGWVLREGEALSAPVVPPAAAADGSRQVRLRLELLFVRHNPGATSLTVIAGGEPLGTVTLDRPDEWRTLELGPYPWPGPARRLGLVVTEPHGAGRRNGVAFDRVEIEWLP